MFCNTVSVSADDTLNNQQRHSPSSLLSSVSLAKVIKVQTGRHQTFLIRIND